MRSAAVPAASSGGVPPLEETNRAARRLPVSPTGEASAPGAKEARKRWAALIKQVYEADPLSCPRCGAEMKIIGFIERHQREVIEKILRHCGLWEEESARAPPDEARAG